MKTKQRSALTKERQQRLATGGGPPTQDAEVDPDIMLIVPSLDTTAPILFSSNMSEDEIAGKHHSFIAYLFCCFSILSIKNSHWLSSQL